MSVWLTVKKNIWLWPTGILGVIAFGILFYEQRLYSDTILQVFFFFQSVIGWLMWVKGYEDQERRVKILDTTTLIAILAFLGFCTVMVGNVMHKTTNASLPHFDALILIFSIAAQTLLMFKYYENWFLWIIVNIVSVGVYLYKGLFLTAAEYVIFLSMCMQGVREWRKELAHV